MVYLKVFQIYVFCKYDNLYCTGIKIEPTQTHIICQDIRRKSLIKFTFVAEHANIIFHLDTN